jgi:HAD superfamily hydrolase (TIGR01509 family)
VFDMDGTLIDSSAVIPDAYMKVVARLGGPSLTRAEVIDAYSVGPPEAMLTHFLGRPSTPDEVDLYHETLGSSARAATVYPGIPEALALLRGRASLAVFTGASLRACRTLLGGVGLDRNFDALVGADEVERSKPEPDGIHLACRRLGVEPAAAAYVGDAPNDLEAARRSGALAAAAAWGHLYRPEEPADVVVRTPGDLPSLVSA